MTLRTAIALLGFSGVAVFAYAQSTKPASPKDTEVWKPVPARVTPGKTWGEPPSDAVALFDGHDLSQWESPDGKSAPWRVENGEFVITPNSGNQRTRASFGDAQLHIEWMIPAGLPPERKGQDRGNSGVFFQERYELQILDSYENVTFSNGQAGAIYKQSIPQSNASRPAGEWQTYDVAFVQPRFAADGSLASPARMTVFHNGVLVQNNVALTGETVNVGQPKYTAHGEAPILLQDHHHAIRFRNVWVRKLAELKPGE